jgi:hypothetical protein
MRLYDEIFKSVDGVAVARCLLVPGGEGYLEGVKSVEEFSSNRLVICFPKNRVEIEGEGLSISKYYEGDLHIAGRIFSWKIDKSEETDR